MSWPGFGGAPPEPGVNGIDDLVARVVRRITGPVALLAQSMGGVIAVRATLDIREVGEYTPDVYSWLAVNPDSELLPVARANGISHFEPVPSGSVLAGQSGNTGCQALAVTLRGMTLGELKPGAERRLVSKEAWLGCLNGVGVGLAGGSHPALD